MIKQVFFNSKFATNYLNGEKKSHLNFILTDSIFFYDYEDVYLSIRNAIFPISFYIINEYNNTISFNGVNFTITEGNYTISTSMTEIKSIISNLNITFNSKTNKLTLSYTSNFTLNGSILNILGFSNKEHSSTNNSLESDNVIDLSGNNNMYIVIDEINNMNINTYDKLKGDTFLNIPIDVNHSDILLYTNYDNIKTQRIPPSLAKNIYGSAKFSAGIVEENVEFELRRHQLRCY